MGVHTCSGRIWRNTRSADRSHSGSQSERRDGQHLSSLVGDAAAVLQRGDERPDGGGAPGGGEHPVRPLARFQPQKYLKSSRRTIIIHSSPWWRARVTARHRSRGGPGAPTRAGPAPWPQEPGSCLSWGEAAVKSRGGGERSPPTDPPGAERRSPCRRRPPAGTRLRLIRLLLGHHMAQRNRPDRFQLRRTHLDLLHGRGRGGLDPCLNFLSSPDLKRKQSIRIDSSSMVTVETI